jgi:hypothetical protein
LRIRFDHRSGLNVDAVLARLGVKSIGVFVWNRHRELPQEFVDGWIDRGRVREFGKDDEAHRKKWRAAGHRRIDHLEHAIGAGAHLRSLERVRKIGLAGGG